MSKCQHPVVKKYYIRKDFVFEGSNVYEGDFLDPVIIAKHPETAQKISGLIRRGFIEVQYQTPEPPKEPPCPASDCLKDRLDNSDEFESGETDEVDDTADHSEAKETKRKRKTKKVDISLEDQRLVDQADSIATRG